MTDTPTILRVVPPLSPQPTPPPAQQPIQQPAVPTGAYDVVLLDPHRPYPAAGTRKSAPTKHHPLMDDQALRDFTVPADLLAPTGVLFMWSTSARLDFAFDLLNHWGLTFRGMAFVWIKTRKDGFTPVEAQARHPSKTKTTTEYVLAASRITKGHPMPVTDESIRQVVLAPKQAQAAKPAIIREHLETLYPNARRIEVFARTPRPGWETWGTNINQPRQQ